MNIDFIPAGSDVNAVMFLSPVVVILTGIILALGHDDFIPSAMILTWAKANGLDLVPILISCKSSPSAVNAILHSSHKILTGAEILSCPMI